MRIIILSILTYAFLPVNSFSQKIDHKDLIGVWDAKDSAKQYKQMIEFVDSVNVKWKISSTNIIKLNYSLDIDTSNNITIINLRGSDLKKQPFNLFWFIKLANKNIIKIQGDFDGKKPLKWIEDEEEYNTATFLKRKKGKTKSKKTHIKKTK